mmetsp:Transcript_10141/g.33511  ORF Transcript_10141/g.33511 Transcript_10141/m.33511 type:complete len:365 (-) Transcript_10141:170-1264(-)
MPSRFHQTRGSRGMGSRCHRLVDVVQHVGFADAGVVEFRDALQKRVRRRQRTLLGKHRRGRRRRRGPRAGLFFFVFMGHKEDVPRRKPRRHRRRAGPAPGDEADLVAGLGALGHLEAPFFHFRFDFRADGQAALRGAVVGWPPALRRRRVVVRVALILCCHVLGKVAAEETLWRLALGNIVEVALLVLVKKRFRGAVLVRRFYAEELKKIGLECGVLEESFDVDRFEIVRVPLGPVGDRLLVKVVVHLQRLALCCGVEFGHGQISIVKHKFIPALQLPRAPRVHLHGHVAVRKCRPRGAGLCPGEPAFHVRALLAPHDHKLGVAALRQDFAHVGQPGVVDVAGGLGLCSQFTHVTNLAPDDVRP